MKILLIVSAFNSMSQKVYCHLKYKGHKVYVEYALCDKVLEKTVQNFDPDLVFCPYLTKKIPDSIWEKLPVMIIHPGILGDRGASSLDWAIFREKKTWGVTILQANKEMDAGDIWATKNFQMRQTSKASLYRKEVSDVSLELVDEVLSKFADAQFLPMVQKSLEEIHPPLKQTFRAINWQIDSCYEIIKKINASDSHPGVLDEILGIPCYLYGVHYEANLKGTPKEILAKRDGAICLGCIDGAIWVSHLKEPQKFKLPATYVLKEKLKGVKELRIPLFVEENLETFKEITFKKVGNIGYVSFDFYNGAMSSQQCIRLKYALETLKKEVDVLVLQGGKNFFSNGIHLNILEDSSKQGEDGWSNINAMNNLIKSILFSDDVITVASFGANAGAGGVFLGLACDFVVAREGTILNPHYKTMGLSGSEYHSYTFVKRVGQSLASQILKDALPISANYAKQISMVDEVFYSNSYDQDLTKFCEEFLKDDDKYYDFLDNKSDVLEKHKCYINDCKEKELATMYPEFWDEKSEFHKLRADFVYKVCPAKTPERLRYNA